MSLKQETIALHRTDENGNKVLQMPITSVENVEGLVVDLPLGYMYFSLEPVVPAGRIPAQGALYNRNLYSDLWAYAQERGLVISESEWQAQAGANNGNCAFYSDGNGSTTFRVPSIKCWIKGADNEEVGSYLEAGLPNITGWFSEAIGAGGTQVSGVFKDAGNISSQTMSSYFDYDGRKITFDASDANSIYGNSNTVQPPSIVGQWLIVAFGVAHNIGEADVANVMQAVEQVQTSVGTLEQGVGTAIDYIVESYRNGTEWYEIYKSGKVRQGGYIAKTSSGNFQTVNLLKNYNSTKYYVCFNNETDSIATSTDGLTSTWNKTTSSFQVRGYFDKTWVAEGQGA